MRLRRLAMLGVALLPVVGLASAAEAGNGHGSGWQKVRLSFTTSGGPGLTFVDEACDTSGQCALLFKIPDAVAAGDVVGSAAEGLAVGLSSNGVTASGYAGTFAGTIKSCGTGGFLFTGTNVYDANGQGVTTYSIVPSSATGDLAGISGTLTANPNGPITGTVRCHRH